ncbi:UDP-N-acetylglucosamine transferase subunit ALG14 homolog isoform X2 [Rhinatrema bivittatum]|uniref:UDP-N-acetylglucosamine transferase subunit ALG14 homolog isoform X2 n=1 Tax=Rhinatrema bivittatum TaxID=194408 RepID=UPI001128E928|nr:UDP-N-acetylglucosamine transferase subunit ALG14 homolog isoform X2 [Rhinatrema bivittatum]
MELSLAAVPLLLAFLFWARRLLVIRAGGRHRSGKKRPLSVLAVAGSGGHTTEILRLLGSLSQFYSPTHYIVADSDKMSEDKICFFEHSRAKESSKFQYSIHRIPRSREVQQSWSSSVLTTFYAVLYALPLTFRLQPDLHVCMQYTGKYTVHPPAATVSARSRGFSANSSFIFRLAFTQCLSQPITCNGFHVVTEVSSVRLSLLKAWRALHIMYKWNTNTEEQTRGLM